ncbi:MAG: ribonuclease P [Candidatus Helarchaeota archaeon]|nr:ribonuclease P [Candidatus Helarchaeota archaeon]
MATKIIKRKKFIKKIAAEQITILFEQARQIFEEDPGKAQRYTDMARVISKRCKVRIPKQYKIQICRHCKSYLMPGKNGRVRIRSKRRRHVTITCLNCKRATRYYY